MIKDVSSLRGLPRLSQLNLPDCAACSPLVDEYGVALPSITHLRHGKCWCVWDDHKDAAVLKGDDCSDANDNRMPLFEKRVKYYI